MNESGIDHESLQRQPPFTDCYPIDLGALVIATDNISRRYKNRDDDNANQVTYVREKTRQYFAEYPNLFASASVAVLAQRRLSTPMTSDEELDYKTGVLLAIDLLCAQAKIRHGQMEDIGKLTISSFLQGLAERGELTSHTFNRSTLHLQDLQDIQPILFHPFVFSTFDAITAANQQFMYGLTLTINLVRHFEENRRLARQIRG